MANRDFMKLIFSGRVGSDPQLHYSPTGRTVTDLNVAVGDGENTEWFRATVWEKQAENCAQFLKKGSRVLVEGRLKTESWQDREGQVHFTLTVGNTAITFLDTKPALSPIDGDEEVERVIPF